MNTKINMGNCAGIDKSLKKDFKNQCDIVKLLLLGTGQSGKSTIVKQMKLIHPLMGRDECGFTEIEKFDAQIAIYTNIADAMLSLLDAIYHLNIEGVETLKKSDVGKDRFEELGNILYTYYQLLLSTKSSTDGYHIPHPTDEIKIAFKELWSNESIQMAYLRRNEFQLVDSTEYFMSSIDRICAADYEPNDQDILRSRVQTTGVVKIQFECRNLPWEMYDVGGQ